MLSPESQAEDMEYYLGRLREKAGKNNDASDTAKIVTAAATAHKAIAMLREQAASNKPKDADVKSLTDAELKAKKIHLVKELSK